MFLDKNVAWNSTINCLDRFANGTFGLVRTKEVEKEAEKYQKAFNIKTPSLNQLVMNLSGGNQQKVVLAKTMAADAEVIIFDEPTRGIDVPFSVSSLSPYDAGKHTDNVLTKLL